MSFGLLHSYSHADTCAPIRGVFYTGGSLNPARSFGPCVVTGEFPGYHWIYWVGPLLGALVASGFYVLIKALEYETVNPDPDYPSEKRGNAAPKGGPHHDAAVAHPEPKHGTNGATHNGNGADKSYSEAPDLEAGHTA